MKLEYKFTTVTLFAAMFVCGLAGTIAVIILKMFWDLTFGREEYGDPDDAENYDYKRNLRKAQPAKKY